MTFQQKFPQKEPLTPDQLKALRLYYTVVIAGNDRIPDQKALEVADLVKLAEKRGIRIRAGGQSETDVVVTENSKWAEYHLPWKMFNDIEVKGMGSTFNTDECFEFAKRYYNGDFETVNKFQRALHGRTPRLLFGKNLKSPANLVIVWSDDGAEKAADTGTRSGIAGHIVRMASAVNIPIINLNNPGSFNKAKALLESINVKPNTQQQQQATPTEPAKGYSADYDDDIPY